jgi:hypothetical protein
MLASRQGTRNWHLLAPTVCVGNYVLATSLYDDPAAELHENGSARLPEHPAHLGCSILRRVLARRSA